MGGRDEGFSAGSESRHSDRVRAILSSVPRPAPAAGAGLALLEPPAIPALAAPVTVPEPVVVPAPVVVTAPVVESPPPPGPRRRRGRRALALFLALLVAGGGGAYYLLQVRKAAAPAAAPAPAVPAVSWATSWNPAVLPIAQFVEHDRGLDFKHPVAVHFLADPAFDHIVSVPQPTSKSGEQDMARALQAMRAMGLVQGDVNLAASENQLQQSSVVGVYEPDHKAIYVRGTSLTPYVRVTLAHELDHALQDQWFGLDKLEAAVPGDDSALQALLEGDATRVENDYQQTLSAPDQTLYSQESDAATSTAASGANPAAVPQVLQDLAGFAETLGPTFVDSLVADGGLAALNDAFHQVPVATAQVLDPVQYPVGWKPLSVALPSIPAGDRTVDKASPFGQFMLFELLGSRLGYDQAWAAVQGWQGDNSVPYSDAGRTCVAVDVHMGTPAQAGALAAAGAQWAKSVPGATVTASGLLVSLRSCDPGATAVSAPLATPPAFDLLGARAALIDMIMSGSRVDFPMGRCVADNVIAALGPKGEPQLLAATLTPAQQQNMFKLAATAAVQCRGSGVT